MNTLTDKPRAFLELQLQELGVPIYDSDDIDTLHVLVENYVDLGVISWEELDAAWEAWSRAQ